MCAQLSLLLGLCRTCGGDGHLKVKVVGCVHVLLVAVGLAPLADRDRKVSMPLCL